MNTITRTTTRARHDAYARRVSELADDAVRAAAKAYRVATALLDLEREAAEQRIRDAAPDFPDDPAYAAALERYFLVTTLHAQTQAAAAAIRRAYTDPHTDTDTSNRHRVRRRSTMFTTTTMFQGNLTADPQRRHTAAALRSRSSGCWSTSGSRTAMSGSPASRPGTTSRSTAGWPRRWSSSCGRAAA